MEEKWRKMEVAVFQECRKNGGWPGPHRRNEGKMRVGMPGPG